MMMKGEQWVRWWGGRHFKYFGSNTHMTNYGAGNFLENLTQNIVLDFTWLYCTTCLKGDGLIIGSPETGDNSPASYKVVKGEGVG